MERGAAWSLWQRINRVGDGRTWLVFDKNPQQSQVDVMHQSSRHLAKHHQVRHANALKPIDSGGRSHRSATPTAAERWDSASHG